MMKLHVVFYFPCGCFGFLPICSLQATECLVNAAIVVFPQVLGGSSPRDYVFVCSIFSTASLQPLSQP